MAWKQKLHWNYAVEIRGRDSSQPGVVQIGSVVGVSIAVADCAAIYALSQNVTTDIGKLENRVILTVWLACQNSTY
jgi:hypothetical protein